jgi:curved DNA-binding protein CbpA
MHSEDPQCELLLFSDKVPEEQREEAEAKFKEVVEAYEILSDEQGWVFCLVMLCRTRLV